VLFPSGTAFAGLIPTPSTFVYFADLLGQAGTQMRGESIPVPDLDGLLMLTTLGIGGVAFFVDLCAVGLRRPALTGLPMLAIYSVPVAVLDKSVSIFPFALGAAGYMWLLVTDSVDRVRRFGRRFTGDGRDIDLWEPSPLAAAGAGSASSVWPSRCSYRWPCRPWTGACSPGSVGGPVLADPAAARPGPAPARSTCSPC
jgi:hypothetical protein